LTALTLTSAAADLLGVVPPRLLMLCAAGLLVGWLTWRTPRAGVAAALWMGTALLAFCLCFVKAYFYYLSLCDYLLLLGAPAGAVLIPVPARQRPLTALHPAFIMPFPGSPSDSPRPGGLAPAPLQPPMAS